MGRYFPAAAATPATIAGQASSTTACVFSALVRAPPEVTVTAMSAPASAPAQDAAATCVSWQAESVSASAPIAARIAIA